jgi:predicted nucleotidyltransferase
MIAIVEDKREAIAALCRRYGVAALYVFGSALREDFCPGESDVDLLSAL